MRWHEIGFQSNHNHTFMIAPAESMEWMQQELPELSCELHPEQGMFPNMQVFSRYACSKALIGDFQKIGQCFTLAETLYRNGSNTVRTAIENVFVFSISRIMSITDSNRNQIKALMPPTLLALYMNQVLHHGY